MRVCGTFTTRQEFSSPIERPQTHAETGESVGPALLAIDHADRISDLETGLTQRADRLEKRTSGGDDVLDQTDELARLERPLDAVGRAVLLRLPAHDHEGEPPREGGRRGERDRAERRSGEAHGGRLELAHRGREPLAQRAEELGLRLEAVLVQVPAGAPARAEQEVDRKSVV